MRTLLAFMIGMLAGAGPIVFLAGSKTNMMHSKNNMARELIASQSTCSPVAQSDAGQIAKSASDAAKGTSTSAPVSAVEKQSGAENSELSPSELTLKEGNGVSAAAADAPTPVTAFGKIQKALLPGDEVREITVLRNGQYVTILIPKP